MLTRLKSLLSFILDAKTQNSYDVTKKSKIKTVIMMRPYQGGDSVNLYQESLAALEMAKKGSSAIHPLFKYRRTPNKPLDFASLIIQEKLFGSAQKKQEYEAEQTKKVLFHLLMTCL